MGTGELSTNARVAEDALRAIFKRSERWNAALLLEEADLFLAKRTSEEFERNALVNVFLRHLEYYQGLLFLTSNRVEEKYQEPDATIRTQIWRHFIPKNWPVSVAERLGKDLEINGRDIKNLMRTAVLLGQGTKHTLSEDLIRTVYNINFRNLQKAPAMGSQGVTNP
ncbi:hypothetical protein WHR41_08151 [Cladosporium halotolerans]|uniref:ATPase AAA-type core domain-containing protein n=1 Tax=Cladosporium halotolerans TaxID=1052096 RepID=A0AB34KGA9_9PEZI